MTTPASPNRKHLVLLGAGRAHVQVLKNLARRSLSDVGVTLVAPHPYYVESRMLAGYVAGQYTPDDLSRPLGPLIQACGANFVRAHVLGLDPVARRLRLSTGNELAYDVLSIDGEPVADRESFEASIPGARQHALFVHPCAAFVHLWPRLCALAMGRALQVAVIGEGLDAAELAMTAAAVLAAPHGSRVTWVASNAEGRPPLADAPPALARRILARLRRLHVTILRDHCVGLDGQSAQLASSAARLQCDAPLIANHTGYPAWLKQAGLQLTDDGSSPRINERMQNESHRQIFIAPPDASAEFGPALTANLRAALGGRSSFVSAPKVSRARAVASGEGQAIAVWGPFGLEGRAVWRWLRRRDRKQLDALFAS